MEDGRIAVSIPSIASHIGDWERVHIAPHNNSLSAWYCFFGLEQTCWRSLYGIINRYFVFWGSIWRSRPKLTSQQEVARSNY